MGIALYDWRSGKIVVHGENLEPLLSTVDGARRYRGEWRVPAESADALAASGIIDVSEISHLLGIETTPVLSQHGAVLPVSMERVARRIGGEKINDRWYFNDASDVEILKGNSTNGRRAKVNGKAALVALGDLSKPTANGWTMFAHQRRAVESILSTDIAGKILGLDFGLGKCLEFGTQVLMYDGSIKRVEEIQVGDQLMGDDSTPRNVLSLARGREEMYRITLKNGDSYGCNRSHVMSIMFSYRFGPYKFGDIADIPLNEYLDLNISEHTRRNCFKHYKVPVSFPEQDIPMEPYLYGAWLGDGHSHGLTWTVNSHDQEIVQRIQEFADTKEGLRARSVDGAGCETHFVTQSKPKTGGQCGEYHFVRNSHDENGKRIDRRYLINSREIRLQLLAGLLDTDGYLIDKVFEITTKWIGLRDDILFLARSLGFSVSHRTKVVNEVDYYRIHISGDTHLIPCITRKKASKRKQIKRPLVYGFTVEPTGMGDYYGFTIDGNGRFLLGDFTVTHNTYTASVVAHALEKTYGLRTMVLCPASLKQNWARELDKMVSDPIILSDHHSQIPANFEQPFVLIADEAHRLAGESQRGESFVQLAEQASFVLPLTGVPVRHGNPETAYNMLRAIGHPSAMMDRKVFASRYSGSTSLVEQLYRHTKDYIIRVQKRDVLDLPPKTRILRPVEIEPQDLEQYDRVYEAKKLEYQEGLRQGKKRAKYFNAALVHFIRQAASIAKVRTAVDIVEELLEQDRQVVLFVAYRETGRRLWRELHKYGMAVITGDTPVKDRQTQVDDFQKGKLKICLCTFGAAGFGLTLTKADTNILVDRPFSVESGDTDNAESRIDRISQLSPTTMVWLQFFHPTQRSPDERLDQLIIDKHSLNELALSGKVGRLEFADGLGDYMANYLFED